ncbi:MAG: hypothetical protein HN849_03170 [Victivallales bacterium]|nr:hypothetical protein [Victivallales bacterium]
MTDNGEQPQPDAEGVTVGGIALGASLCGGVVTLLLTPLLMAVWGVAVGTMGLVGVVRKGRGRGKAVGAILVGLLLVVFSVQAPMVMDCTRLTAQRFSDHQNMKQIASAIADFRASHGRPPTDLGELLDAGCIPDGKVLVCPGQECRRPVTGNDVRAGRCGYLYWGAQIPTDAPPGTVIACTRPGLLDKPGIFRDGFLGVPWNRRTIRGDNFVGTLTLGGQAGCVLQPSKEILARIEKAGPEATGK